MSFGLRPARAEDAVAIGRVHVEAWRESYGGIVPAERLATLDPAERAAVWAGSIAAGRHVTVVEDAAGIAGFSLCGEQREPGLGGPGDPGASSGRSTCCAARRGAASGAR